MRLQGPALAALLISLLAALLPVTAIADGVLDPKNLSGLVVSLGEAHTNRDPSGVRSGWFADANYSRVFINGGVSYKDLNGPTLGNVYAGTGIAGVLQIQMGYGTEGLVKRIRSDINFTKAYDFFTGTRRNRYNQSLGNRLTLTFAIEEYNKDRRFDNFHAGIGLLY
jgi:hypothetical protein